MSTTIELLRRAYDFENDIRRPRKLVGHYWQHHSIRATKDEVRQLVAEGYACIAVHSGPLVKYELTERGREMACRDIEEILESVSKTEVLEALSLVVGFDDIKEALAIALATRRKVNFMLEGPPASIRGNTEVWVDLGNGPQSLPIADLKGKSFKSLSVNPFSQKSGWYEAEVTSHQYEGEWVEITGTGVQAFDVTATHSLVSYNPITKCLEPKRAAELKKGEIIPVLANWEPFKAGSKIKVEDTILELDEEFGFIIGFWLGDGGLSQGNTKAVTYSNINRAVLERVKSFWAKLPGYRNYSGGCINGKSLVIQHQELLKFFKDNFLKGDGRPGIKGRTSNKKYLPGWILSSPLAFIRGLLNGYYYADGTVTNGAISAGSSSPTLIRDISMLLTRLGIVPGIHHRSQSGQNVVIRQYDAACFMEKIGLFRENKEVLTSVLQHDESFKVPFPFEDKAGASFMAAIRKGRKSQSFTRRAGEQLLLSDWSQQLRLLLEADIRWVRVEKVFKFREAAQEVYDLSVTSAETFVLGNRVLVHNCAKSVILEGLRSAVPSAFQAFGSRTSAAGLSEVLFEYRPQVLLLDEADKMRHDVYSVLLGLMESGEILETKSGKTRGIRLETTVIAACNSSKKMSPEFLSRFAFHGYFPEYTRDEFIAVVLGMLGREECPEEIARRIGARVFDEKLGDVRKARGVWNLMMAPTDEEIDRVIHMSIKYGPQNALNKKRKPTGRRLPGME